MEKSKAIPVVVVVLVWTMRLLAVSGSALTHLGVNYGTQGNNLPPPNAVVAMYKKLNVRKMRLFEPLPTVLQALRGSGIEVSLGIRNEELQGMASDPAAVASWIAATIEPYSKSVIFKYITVGNEVVPGPIGSFVLPVMQSLQNGLSAKRLARIKVTTVIPASVLSASYPPSAAQFSSQAAQDLRGILRFLSTSGAPLMINVYPYFAYASDPQNVRLDYAQFTATGTVVQDGALSYNNLFDAIVDGFVWAMEKEGGARVGVLVSETGWPSAGNGAFTTPELASIYNKNLVRHLESPSGTPKRPGASIDGYIFAMFNENLKPTGVEQNFGLFHPDMTLVDPAFSINRPSSSVVLHTLLASTLHHIVLCLCVCIMLY